MWKPPFTAISALFLSIRWLTLFHACIPLISVGSKVLMYFYA